MGYVRVSFSAVALRKSVNTYFDKPIRALRSDRQLRNSLARLWGEATTRFVPRSAIQSGHHMQTFYVSDGRVMWTRPARQNDSIAGITKGEDIADLLLEGPIHGHFQERADGGNEWGPHQPQSNWTNVVRPDGDTTEWQRYTQASAMLIAEKTDRIIKSV